MPQIQAAKKDLRKVKKRTVQNLQVKRLLKKTIKETETAIKKGEGNFAELLKKTQKTLDKAAKKGVIKKNKASRKLSRLAAQVKKMAKK